MPAPLPITTSGELLAQLFAAWPEVKKKQVRTWLKFKAITVNGRPITQFDYALKPGDVVAVRQDTFAVANTKLEGGLRIVHEDAEILVVEKPEGLLSIASDSEPQRTAYRLLTEHVRNGPKAANNRIFIVHRLDRDTSGLMVFAKTEAAKSALQKNWAAAEKIYLAVVEGEPPSKRGTFSSHLDESSPVKVFSTTRNEFTRQAVTHYRVLKHGAGRTLVELILETGRRHQIRVHLADAGCPIVGDGRYRAKTNPVRRLALHAHELKFPHPATGALLHYTSPLPEVLVRLLHLENDASTKPRHKARLPE